MRAQHSLVPVCAQVADLEVMASVEAPPPIFTLCFEAVRALMGLPVDVPWRETRRVLREVSSQPGGAQEPDHIIINSAKRWLSKPGGGKGSQESEDARGMLDVLREWRRSKETPGQHSKDADEMLGLLREEHKRRLEETGKPSAVYAQVLARIWNQFCDEDEELMPAGRLAVWAVYIPPQRCPLRAEEATTDAGCHAW